MRIDGSMSNAASEDRPQAEASHPSIAVDPCATSR